MIGLGLLAPITHEYTRAGKYEKKSYRVSIYGTWMGSVLESSANRYFFDSFSNYSLPWIGSGSSTRFHLSVNSSNVADPPKRLCMCKCQSRAEMRPSCQSCQRGSFSMADQSSSADSDNPEAIPFMARAKSIRINTRPISKMTARTFRAATPTCPPHRLPRGATARSEEHT